MTKTCACGAKLKSPADLAHGTCRYCRVDAKKRVRKRKAEPAPTEAMFDIEPQQRLLVPLEGWPDYHAQGLT